MRRGRRVQRTARRRIAGVADAEDEERFLARLPARHGGQEGRQLGMTVGALISITG